MSFYSRLLSCKPAKIKTDAEYARYLGIRKDLLHKWKLQHEAGHTDFLPKKHLIEQVAEKLDCSPGWLSFGPSKDKLEGNGHEAH